MKLTPLPIVRTICGILLAEDLLWITGCLACITPLWRLWICTKLKANLLLKLFATLLQVLSFSFPSSHFLLTYDTAMLPFSFILLLILIWFLLRAAIREIQQERISILKLFLGIPKDNILAIVGHIRSKEIGEIDEEELFAADEDEVSTFSATVDLNGEADAANQGTLWVLRNTRLSMLRSFFLRFLVSLVLVFLLVLVASSIVLASVQDFRTSVEEVNLAGQRRTVLAHLQSSTLALAYYAEISRVQPTFNVSSVQVNPTVLRGYIQEDLQTLESVNYDLNYGVGGHGGIGQHPFLIDLTYHNESCVALPGYAYTCTGMNSLLVYIAALGQVVLSLPDSRIGFNTTQVATLSDIAFQQLGPLFLVALNFYREKAYDVIDGVRTAVIVTFVLIFPVLLAVNFMLRPMSVQIKQEHQRTLRMLLMIPLNVIDNTPAIKDYLDNMLRDAGRTPWYRNRSRKNQQKDERFLSTHEPLLQAVVRVFISFCSGFFKLFFLFCFKIISFFSLIQFCRKPRNLS